MRLGRRPGQIIVEKAESQFDVKKVEKIEDFELKFLTNRVQN